MKAQKDGKGDIVSIPNHLRATLRAGLDRQIKARVDFVVHKKLAVLAFGTTIVRLERIHLGDIQHRRHK